MTLKSTVFQAEARRSFFASSSLPGAVRASLEPTGNVLDHVDGIPISCVDFANPIVMVAASAVGKTGYETKQELDADTRMACRNSRHCACARRSGCTWETWRVRDCLRW